MRILYANTQSESLQQYNNLTCITCITCLFFLCPIRLDVTGIDLLEKLLQVRLSQGGFLFLTIQNAHIFSRPLNQHFSLHHGTNTAGFAYFETHCVVLCILLLSTCRLRDQQQLTPWNTHTSSRLVIVYITFTTVRRMCTDSTYSLHFVWKACSFSSAHSLLPLWSSSSLLASLLLPISTFKVLSLSTIITWVLSSKTVFIGIFTSKNGH